VGNEKNKIVRALTVQQPWAWALLERKYPYVFEPFAPRLRGYFLLHSGIAYDWDAHQWFAEHIEEPPFYLRKAQILGYARLTMVMLKPLITPSPPMESNEFAFRITDPHRFLLPQVAAGRRGFWKVPRRMLKELKIPLYVRMGLLS